MKKCKFNYLVVALVLLMPCLAFALPGAHDPASTSGITCNSCHTTGATMGNMDSNYATNVCLRCHSATGVLTGKTAKNFAPEDYANPFNSTALSRGSALQTSHKWFGSDTVPAAGSLPPVDNSLNGLNKNANFISGGLFCARCHNVHGTSGLSSNDSPYLRYPNNTDQLCLNCHRPRDTKDHTVGTHPVNVIYSSAYKANPAAYLQNPVTNVTNPTGQVKLIDGKVVCSSCHKTHNADSRTSTFDPYSTGHTFGQLSSSKGYLLRVNASGKTKDDLNICTNCHAGKKNHNYGLRGAKPAVQCNDCHSGHVEYDAGAVAPYNTPNVYLVRRYLQYTTAGRVSKRILYNSTTTKYANYYDATNKGVCQSCHNPPADHLSGSTVVGDHAVCTDCHSHNEPTGAFSAAGGGCTACHGQPPTTTAAGGPTGKAGTYATFDEALTPHASHAGGTQYNYSCTECHQGNTHNSGNTYTDVFVTKTGIKAGASASYTSPTCTTVYCHSSGRGTYKGGVTTIAWGNNKNSIIGLPAATRCATCHDTSTYSTSHAKHITTMGYGCVTCHAATVSDNTTLLAAAKLSGGTHVNTVKDVLFSGGATSAPVIPTITGSSCSTVACHSNGSGAAPVIAPDWANATSGQCNACHLTRTSTPVLATGTHTAHFALLGATNTICSSCHTYTTETAVTHVNGTVNVTTGCATNTCHGSIASPTWGANTTNDTCTKCHGTPTGTGVISAAANNRYLVAPIDAAASDTGKVSTTNVKTGAHQTHLRFLNGFSNYSTVDYRCQSCHGTPLPAAGTHSDGTSTPQGKFRNIATNWGAMTGQTYTGTTCANTYCHNPAGTGGTLVNAGSNTSPSWTDATYIDNSGKNQINCGKCHKVPGDAGFTKQAAHGAGMVTDAVTSCAGCHGHNGDTSGSLGQRHMDGKYYANGACDSCHGYPPVASMTGIGTVGNYENAKLDTFNGGYGGGGGHHTVHLLATVKATDGFTPCLPCHPNNMHNQGGIPIVRAQVQVNNDPTDLTYRFDDSRSKRYNTATLSCSNVSCHFQPTPAW